LCGYITKDEIREPLKKMPNGKAEDPDQIPVEVWKCLGEERLEWLTELFNIIFRTAKMPRENGGLVQSSLCTRTNGIFKIVIILGM